MMQDNETRKRLLECAQDEFMEHGFLNASLRKICKKAGVTTGAMYFFFKDKNDLFSCLVSEVFEQLKEMLKSHYNEELDNLKNNVENAKSVENMEKDIQVIHRIVQLMYQNRDKFLLLLTKSQGTDFENCVDEVLVFSEKHYMVLMKETARRYYKKEINDYTVHWLAHMQIDAFTHLLTHVADYEEAVKESENIVRFLIGGWFGILEEKKW